MYLALYRKWRPLVFDDVIAQPHITTPLKNQVISGKTAHAYLFTGSRGTGKTTCSKILAKAVNCPNTENGNPCLDCDICRGIDDGSLLDVVEIDAASNNGVDNIREIREEANFTPAVCKYRVYIIDEAHMLSDGAFSALLKIMEEPPAHAIFILATTEVQKIPATILSRCQRYDFRRISSDAIAERLMYVAKQEKIDLSGEAAALIAKISDGGMRDALSLLDRCTAINEHITDDIVSSAAGIAGRDYLFDLSDAIIENNISRALGIINELHSQISNLGSLCDELITHFRNIMIAKTVTKPESLIVAPPGEIQQYLSAADRLSLDTILSHMKAFEVCSAQIKKTASKRLVLEMTLVEICSGSSAQSNGDFGLKEIEFLNNRIKELESKITQTASSGASNSARQSSNESGFAAQSEYSLPDYAPPSGSDNTATAVKTNKNEKLDYSKFTPVACFPEILEQLKANDPALYGMLFGAKAFENGEVMLISTDKDLFSGLMHSHASAERLSDAVFKQTGKRYRFKIKNASKNNEENRNIKQTPSLLDELEKAAKDAGVLS